MDEVESVVVSVRDVVDVGRAEEWFAVVCQAFAGCGGDWAVFKEQLAAGAADKSFGGEVVEAFVRFVDARVSDPVGVVGQVCARRDELPRLYEELVAQLDHEAVDEAPAEAVEEWDEATAAQWYAHLTTANDWVGWAGGGEAEWAEFTEWFLYFADQQQVRDHAVLLVERVQDDPGGITAGFANLGIETAAAAAAPTAEPSGWAERTATRYLELTSGKGWAGWTGEDEDWDLFTQWFLYYAAEDGDHDDARAFLDAVERSGDKRAAFAAHGITLAGRQAEEPAQQEVAVAAVSPVSAEELEQLGISQADMDAATQEIDALLATLDTE